MNGLRRLLVSLVAVALPAQANVSKPEAAALQAAVARFAELITNQEVLGAVLMVTQGDEVLVHEALGFRDVDQEREMQKDTLFRMASNTKAVTAAAVLKLVEEGQVGLDDSIAKWFPTFSNTEQGGDILVRHLLTHSSGLRIPTLFVMPLMKKSAQHPEAPNLVLECARFGGIGPKEKPGQTYAYSNPGYNLLAGLVEVASGMSFEAYCQKHFYVPLGMVDTCNHETRADLDRMSVVARRRGDRWRARWSPGDRPTLPFVRGSGGMISTAADFTGFCKIMLNQGRAAGRQLLSPESVAAATKDQIPHISSKRYGFGWGFSTNSAFSHSGSDGTWAWCDPERNIVGCVFTQTQGSKRLGAARQQFRRAVSKAVEKIEKASK